MSILLQDLFKEHFTNVDAVSHDGESLIIFIDKNIDIDKNTIYANVQGYIGGDTNRGKLYHTLKFDSKTPLNHEPGNGRYFYTFLVTNPDPQNPLPKAFKVTIQPWNIFPAKFLAHLDSPKQLTFSVTDSSLFKQGETYVIRSYCLDKYVKGEGIAKCINARHDTLHGHIATFELNPEDYETFLIKSHCRFSFAEKSLFGHRDWFQFKKSKSVKKRTKTVVKKMSKRSASPKRSKSPKRIVKNVKKQTKRSRPVKNE
jgi:hypothetical protein